MERITKKYLTYSIQIINLYILYGDIHVHCIQEINLKKKKHKITEMLTL